MAQEQKKYDKEYKVQAIKLAKEIGAAKAATELGIPVNTLYGEASVVCVGPKIRIWQHLPRRGVSPS